MRPIKVTCAVIMKNDKVLACQRKENSEHPLQWEFPGGKVEELESYEQCIIREISEELNVHIVVEFKMNEVEYSYSNKSILLIPLKCNIVGGEIELHEHKAFCWLPITDIHKINWSLADKKLIAANSAWFK